MIKCDNVQSYVKWTFIVELASWMGRFYERLVGIVKCALWKVIGRKLLTRHTVPYNIKRSRICGTFEATCVCG